MTSVGKEFPNLSVNAMNEMGDTISVNIFEKAKSEKKKILLFWYPKDFTFVCPTELHAFQKLFRNLRREILLLLEHLVILQKCTLLG